MGVVRRETTKFSGAREEEFSELQRGVPVYRSARQQSLGHVRDDKTDAG